MWKEIFSCVKCHHWTLSLRHVQRHITDWVEHISLHRFSLFTVYGLLLMILMNKVTDTCQSSTCLSEQSEIIRKMLICGSSADYWSSECWKCLEDTQRLNKIWLRKLSISNSCPHPLSLDHLYPTEYYWKNNCAWFLFCLVIVTWQISVCS